MKAKRNNSKLKLRFCTILSYIEWTLWHVPIFLFLFVEDIHSECGDEDKSFECLKICRFTDKDTLRKGNTECIDEKTEPQDPCFMECVGSLQKAENQTQCFCDYCRHVRGKGFCRGDFEQISEEQCISHVCESRIAKFRGYHCKDPQDKVPGHSKMSQPGNSKGTETDRHRPEVFRGTQMYDVNVKGATKKRNIPRDSLEANVCNAANIQSVFHPSHWHHD